MTNITNIYIMRIISVFITIVLTGCTKKEAYYDGVYAHAVDVHDGAATFWAIILGVMAFIFIISFFVKGESDSSPTPNKNNSKASYMADEFTNADVAKLKTEEEEAIQNNSIVELLEKRAAAAPVKAKIDLAVSFLLGKHDKEHTRTYKSRWVNSNFEALDGLSSLKTGDNRTIKLPKSYDKAKYWLIKAMEELSSSTYTDSSKISILKDEIFESPRPTTKVVIPRLKELVDEIESEGICNDLYSLYYEHKKQAAIKRFRQLQNKIKKNEEGKRTYHLCDQYFRLAEYYIDSEVVDKNIEEAAKYCDRAIEYASQLFSEKTRGRKVKEFTERKKELLKGYKECPMCAEIVPSSEQVCRYCEHEF